MSTGYEIIDVKVRRWNVPRHRRDVHWERARQKFNIAGEAVYDADDAGLFAEDGMQDGALDHWDPEPERRCQRRRDWWNRPAAKSRASGCFSGDAENPHEMGSKKGNVKSNECTTSRKFFVLPET
jgi:hypothetical protein